MPRNWPTPTAAGTWSGTVPADVGCGRALERITNLHGIAGRRHLGAGAARSVRGAPVDGPHPNGPGPAVRPASATPCTANRRRALLASWSRTPAPGRHDTLIAGLRPRPVPHARAPRLPPQLPRQLRRSRPGTRTSPVDMPAPLNLFMNIPLGAGRRLSFEPSTCRPGDQVTLAAQRGAVSCLSACPQDLVPINGSRPASRGVSIAVERPDRSRPDWCPYCWAPVTPRTRIGRSTATVERTDQAETTRTQIGARLRRCPTGQGHIGARSGRTSRRHRGVHQPAGEPAR